MLGYYRRHIIQLSLQLQLLRSHPDDLHLLVALQLQIISRIMYTERRISHYRAQLHALRRQFKSQRLSKTAAASLKRDISVMHRKVKQNQWLLFVWRCFGDGIAFAYLDKWAMKPLLYNVDNPGVKQGAGHITGKEGLKREIGILQEAVSVGVPALLTDITNSIRHGDVCLLAGNDPQLIEVKSSENTNLRVARQTESIRSIHSYLATDEAINVRGVPHIRRVEPSVPEKNYLDMLDGAIGTALADGLFVADLEPGTRLVVLGNVRRPDYSKIFSGIEQPTVYMLNVAKNEEAWGCYYPFSLALKTPDNLYAFLHGDVYMIVAFDLTWVQSRAAGMGLTFSVLNETDWVYQLEQPMIGSAEPMVGKISRHFAARMAFELLSWEWVLNMEKLRFAQLQAQWREETKA